MLILLFGRKLRLWLNILANEQAVQRLTDDGSGAAMVSGRDKSLLRVGRPG
jgi:hypothetical protein